VAALSFWVARGLNLCPGGEAAVYLQSLGRLFSVSGGKRLSGCGIGFSVSGMAIAANDTFISDYDTIFSNSEKIKARG
jgi:hypothetical protein